MNEPTPQAIPLTDVWVDLYAISGIAVGTQVLVTTRGKHVAYLVESVGDPGDHDGIQLYPLRQCIVDEGSIGLWARAAHNQPHTSVIVQIDQNV